MVTNTRSRQSSQTTVHSFNHYDLTEMKSEKDQRQIIITCMHSNVFK